MKKYCMITVLALFLTALGNRAEAQQKASERSYAAEVQKIRQKQAERKQMLQRQEVVSNQPQQAAPAEAAKKPAPAVKASERPMLIPSRRKVSPVN